MEALVEQLVAVIEKDILTVTTRGVSSGNKVFGAAVLTKQDLEAIVVATNDETTNPLFHGEIVAINSFYAIDSATRPPAQETFFLSTHEPCPLCLSAIAWAGFKQFFYLFDYQATNSEFSIPHDLKMHEQIFRLPGGHYAKDNDFWQCWSLRELLDQCVAGKASLERRINQLGLAYAQLSDSYQDSKSSNRIPLN